MGFSNLEQREKNFKDCIAKPLRFEVGDKVLAYVKGGFKPGTVTGQYFAQFAFKTVAKSLPKFAPPPPHRISF